MTRSIGLRWTPGNRWSREVLIVRGLANNTLRASCHHGRVPGLIQLLRLPALFCSFCPVVYTHHHCRHKVTHTTTVLCSV